MAKDKRKAFFALQNVMTFLSSIVSLLAAIIGCFALSKVYNVANENVLIANDSVVNLALQDFKTKYKTIAQELWNAQTLYLAEDYYGALNIYEKIYAESGIACLNMGYFYSHGLACDRDFNKACYYYMSAYQMGNTGRVIKLFSD